VTDDRSSHPARPRAPRRLTILLVVNSVVLVAALGGLLWALSRPLGASVEDGLTLDGEALLKDEAARQGIGEGQPAPGFAAAGGDGLLGLTTLSGDPVQLRSFLGRPVWVVFWATYCDACQKEEPDLRRAFETHRADGLVLLAIDIGEDAGTVRRYAEARDLPWTILLDGSGAAVEAFGAIGTPSHYFIAADGTIQSRAFGRLEYTEMEEHLQSLLNPPRGAAGAAGR
jgi:peroxiredoxin